MSNSEDLTLKLPNASEASDAPKTNPITLDELYAQFREERATNAFFRDEIRGIMARFEEGLRINSETLSRFKTETNVNFERVLQRLDDIEKEQRLMRKDIGNASACRYASKPGWTRWEKMSPCSRLRDSIEI